MADILTAEGQVVPLRLILVSGAEDKYPQARVYDDDGTPTPLDTIDLDHIDQGYYFGEFTVPEQGKFTVVYTVYEDADHETVSPENGQAEDLIIADFTATEQAEAQLNVSYDDSTQVFRAACWLDRKGGTITNPTEATITLKYQDDSTIFTESSTSPFANGIFFFQESGVALLDNKLYYVEVVLEDDLGSVSTIQTFSTAA